MNFKACLEDWCMVTLLSQTQRVIAEISNHSILPCNGWWKLEYKNQYWEERVGKHASKLHLTNSCTWYFHSLSIYKLAYQTSSSSCLPSKSLLLNLVQEGLWAIHLPHVSGHTNMINSCIIYRKVYTNNFSRQSIYRILSSAWHAGCYCVYKFYRTGSACWVDR